MDDALNGQVAEVEKQVAYLRKDFKDINDYVSTHVEEADTHMKKAYKCLSEMRLHLRGKEIYAKTALDKIQHELDLIKTEKDLW